MNITGLGFGYKTFGLFFTQPVAYFRLLLLQVFVDLEEMVISLSRCGGHPPGFLPSSIGITDGHTQDFLVGSLFIPHLKGRYRLHPNQAAWKGGFSHQG